MIGLTGRKRSGKDTAATALFPEYVAVAFAAPLKAMLGVLITPEEMEEREVVLPRFGKSPRFLLQSLGTEWGRQMVHDSIWINIARHTAERHLARGVRVVFTDVRFDNEATLVREMGGVVWRIECESAPADAHSSEAGVSSEFLDLIISNNGTVDEFRRHVRLKAGIL